MCPAEVLQITELKKQTQHVGILDAGQGRKFGWKYIEGTNDGFRFVDTSSMVLPREILPGDSDLNIVSAEGKFIIRAISEKEAKKLRAKPTSKKLFENPSK